MAGPRSTPIRRLLLLTTSVGLVSSLLAAVGASASTTAAPAPVVLGAYTSGAPWNAGLLDTFATRAGRYPQIFMWYQDWATAGSREFDPVKMNAVVARGAMPMVTWEPWDHTGPADQPKYSLKKLLSGTYDRYIHGWAKAAKSWGKPFLLRFAHEMNGNWYPWSVGHNGNTGSQFVSVWKRVVGIFRSDGATNVRWVWSPNVIYDGSASFASVYPGAAYVDWVGLDGYNWGTSVSWHTWQSPAEVFGTSYDEILAVEPNKPLMIAETSSTELGGSKPAWIDALATDLATRLPRVRALVWFDENKETDWRIDSSAQTLTEFRLLANSTLLGASIY